MDQAISPPHDNPRPARLFFVGKRVPTAERDELVERLRALVNFFEVDRQILRGRLAEEFLGFDKSTITNAINRKQVSAELRDRFEERLGVQKRYWKSQGRLPPAECVSADGINAAKAFAIQRLTLVAKRHGHPSSVLGRLAFLDPPKDKNEDPWWWIEQYFAILAEETLKPKTKAHPVG